MPSNTPGADINEIWFAYVAAGKRWNVVKPSDAKQNIEQRIKSTPAEEVEDQVGRADVMYAEFKKWANRHGYAGNPKEVYWTARKGSVPQQYAFDQKENPTDVLLVYGGNKLIGVSAKSTKGPGDVGFKNPGMGTIEQALKIDLSSILLTETNTLIQKFKLPKIDKARKKALRAGPKYIRAQADESGSKVLLKMRNVMFEKLKRLPPKQLKKYLIEDWMDAGGLYPPYVKVTGHGVKGKYHATLVDPKDNDKIRAVVNDPVRLEKAGNNGILVYAGGRKVLRMRAKFADEKLASSIKFSADPD